MDAEERIAEKQAAQDAKSAEAARRAIEAEGGISVAEFEDEASRTHGIRYSSPHRPREGPSAPHQRRRAFSHFKQSFSFRLAHS